MLNTIGGFIASRKFLCLIMVLVILAFINNLAPDTFDKQAAKAQKYATETSLEKSKSSLTEEIQANLETGNYIRSVNNSGNADLKGLNVRKEPCSEEIVGVVDWGTAGTLGSAEKVKMSCFGQDYQWYKITWESGISGYSATEFVEFKSAN